MYLDKMHKKLAVNARTICDRYGTVMGMQWWWLLRETPIMEGLNSMDLQDFNFSTSPKSAHLCALISRPYPQKIKGEQHIGNILFKISGKFANKESTYSSQV